jgi:methylglyoxal reductase
MEQRTLGASDLKLPVISFGAWALGGSHWGGPDDEAGIRAIRRGIDLGVTCIDTAPIYGQGHSETVVGRAIEGRRDEVIIATKCGFRWDSADPHDDGWDSMTPDGRPIRIHNSLRPESVRHECEQSLRRLGIDVIDLYQCHAPDPGTPVEDTMAALTALRDEGKIREIGVSNFPVDLMERSCAAAPVRSSQSMLNLLIRGVEQDVLPFCHAHGMGLVVYSPMVFGLLTGKVTMDRAFPENDLRHNHPLFTPDMRAKVLAMLDDFRPIAEKHGATLGQIAINWVACQPGVATVLAGARNESQVEENAGAAGFRLDVDDLRFMREAAEKVT